MKLTREDKQTLIDEFGYDEFDLYDDMDKLERANEKTTYTLFEWKENGKEREREITRKTAIRKLGRTMWLNGLVRAMFCGEAFRPCPVWEGPQGGAAAIYFEFKG